MSKGKLARCLHLGHRWLGIVLGLMLVLWFVSGLVMLFVARPQLDEAERLAGLPVLADSAIRVSPEAAWQALGLPDEPQSIRLNAAGGRPAYRILANKQWHAVDAENGRIFEVPDAGMARHLVSQHAGTTAIITASAIDLDQWTVYRRFDALRPFWQVELADGRHYYVSTRSGEVALDTSPGERAWNWIGSVVHWIYITPLRQNTPLWRNIVLWSSFLALLLSISGLWLGWQRLRLRAPYSDGRWTPYRTGWKRWHHVLGLTGGLILMTWLLSGWLSLAPVGLAGGASKPGRAQTLRVQQLTALPEPAANRLEIEWLALGEALVRIEKYTDGTRISLNQQPAKPQLSLAEIEAAVSGLNAGAIRDAQWLAVPDTRYFPLRHHPRSFPVARLELADADASVLYISPCNGRIEVISNRHDFAHRWLYQGLHRLDIPVLVAAPLLRDILVITLSLLGMALSLTGCVLGWRRLFNQARSIQA